MVKEEIYPKLTPVEFVKNLKQNLDLIVSKIPHNEFLNERRLKHLVDGYDAKYGGGDVWNLAKISILDYIMRIFFRLTQKPIGTLVPLKDLLDSIDTKDNWATSKATNHTYLFFQDLLSELNKAVPFPILYYPSSAVFERDNDTLNHIIVIESVKAVLNGTCPQCNGNFRKEQVESFTKNQTITCEYCNHSIKAEWISDRKT